MIFWAKYGTQTTFSFPMLKMGFTNFAVSADWTPAAADSAISKDQGNFADTTNTVAAVGGSPTRTATGWKLTLSATELTAAQADVQIVDAATKVVEDQWFTVYTYGNASAKIAADLSDLVRLGLTALPNAAAEASGGLPTLSAAQASNGTIQSNVHRWLTGTPNALQTGRVDSYVGAMAASVIAAASFAANALDAVWSTAARTLTAGTNIVLAKGVGVTGFNDITAADVWAAGTRTLTSFGTLVADIWANATRTLTAISDSAGVTTLLSRLGTPAGASIAADIAQLYAAVDTEIPAILAAVDTEIAAIKAQTDKLTFNAGLEVSANIKSINGTPVNGDGSATPWGP